jgi:ribonuclease E
MVARDDSLIPPAFRLERLRPYGTGEAPPARPIRAPVSPEDENEDESESEALGIETEFEARADAAVVAEAGPAGEGAEAEQDNSADDERGRRRRRRRRRRDEPREVRHATAADEDADGAEADGPGRAEPGDAAREAETEAERRRRRRGRRGGRLRPRRDEPHDERRDDVAASDTTAEAAHPAAAETIEIVAAPASPIATPDETMALDPWAADSWSARYGVETASLAPFAGEPPPGEPPTTRSLDAEARQPEPTAEPTGAKVAAEAPADAFLEPEAVPIAEAEEGVPFVSDSERKFEAAESGAQTTPRWDDPAGAEAGMAMEFSAEPGSSASYNGGVAEPQPSAEPRRAGSAPEAAISANRGNAELAAAETAPEPVVGSPAESVPAPAGETAPEPAWAETLPAPSEPIPKPVSRPAEDLLVVTEKPATPRRGWWRRVTHS